MSEITELQRRIAQLEWWEGHPEFYCDRSISTTAHQKWASHNHVVISTQIGREIQQRYNELFDALGYAQVLRSLGVTDG